MNSKRRTSLGVAACALVLGSTWQTPTAWAGAHDDLVLLVNGGRLRGAIMVEDPATGVVIRLADGTVRKLRPQEVKKIEYGLATPVPPPAAPAPPAAPQTPPPPPIAVAPPPYYPQAPSYPYGYPTPGHPLGSPPQSERRSKGLFITGLVLMPTGAAAAAAGGVLCAVGAAGGAGCGSEKIGQADLILLAAGGGVLALGLTFILVGGSRKTVDPSEAGAQTPTLRASFGPGALGFTGAF